VNDLDILIVKRKPIEAFLDMLSLLSGNPTGDRSLTYLPFGVPNLSISNQKDHKPDDNKDQESAQNRDEKKKNQESKDTTKSDSLSQSAQGKIQLNDEFIAFDWLQDLSSSVSSRSVSQLLSSLAQSIYSRAALGRLHVNNSAAGRIFQEK
jgi:hypothetical protein